MTGENIDAGAILVLIFHGVLMSSAAFMGPIYYFKEFYIWVKKYSPKAFL